MRKMTLHHLQTMKEQQQKIAMLTVYDATLAQVGSEAGVDIFLVGDSLGMVLKGEENTINVTVDEIAYHTACVAAGNKRALIMSDLPFMSYYNLETAAKNAKQLLQNGAEILKIEGGKWLCDTVHFLSERGVPICAHIGLTPQFIHQLGGFKVQGRHKQDAENIFEAAVALQAAGASLILLECVPYDLAERISLHLKIPVIGIGAGPYCDGQVLVAYDLLGLTKPAKFVKNFLATSKDGIKGAIQNYVDAVHHQQFPTLEHSFE